MKTACSSRWFITLRIFADQENLISHSSRSSSAAQWNSMISLTAVFIIQIVVIRLWHWHVKLFPCLVRNLWSELLIREFIVEKAAIKNVTQPNAAGSTFSASHARCEEKISCSIWCNVWTFCLVFLFLLVDLWWSQRRWFFHPEATRVSQMNREETEVNGNCPLKIQSAVLSLDAAPWPNSCNQCPTTN